MNMDFSKFRKNMEDDLQKILVKELRRCKGFDSLYSGCPVLWQGYMIADIYIYMYKHIYIFIHDLLALFCVCTLRVLVFSNIVCVFPSFFLFRLMDSVIAEAVHGGATQNYIVKSITVNGKCKPSWQRTDWIRALYITAPATILAIEKKKMILEKIPAKEVWKPGLWKCFESYFVSIIFFL